jgi:hypothetical protein
VIDFLLDPRPWLATGAILLLGLMAWIGMWSIESHYRKREDYERRRANGEEIE